MTRILLPIAVAALLLTACEGRIGMDEGNAAAETNGVAASAEGKAEDGRVTIKAPGIDMSINIPESIRTRTNVDGDSKIIYPGATLSGMHVQGGSGDLGNSGVEIRFTSADAPDRVAAWYRDSARAGDFAIRSASSVGNSQVISGITSGEEDPFTLRLNPGASGGTDARLALSDRR